MLDSGGVSNKTAQQGAGISFSPGFVCPSFRPPGAAALSGKRRGRRRREWTPVLQQIYDQVKGHLFLGESPGM